MVKFLLIRHGESVANLEKRFCGQGNAPLTQKGLSQAQTVTKYILENFKIDAVYSSDLIRAYATVEPLAKELGLEIKTCPALREVDVGVWSGNLVSDIERDFPKEIATYRADPENYTFRGGECYGNIRYRALDALREIALENEGKTIAVGTHGGIIRNLIAMWRGQNVLDITPMKNTSITEIHFSDGNFFLQGDPFCGHLEE
ncbi:MAG: histidine phosphatase family protein [Clostridia bacterium]|nr:histidine phosphatase family protein [Clostridia bacterium]